jgi:tetratricopeptide (TPR) repeat protein
MPFFLSLLLAQVGPAVTPGAAPPLPHQLQMEPRRPARRRSATPLPVPSPAAAEPGREQPCAGQAEQPPSEAEETARAWLAAAQGPDKASAGECLGVALARGANWNEAASTFLAARDAAAEQPLRARLGAMAGNAALAGGNAAAALAALDRAAADAGGDGDLAGGIAIDRARALVALKRDGEAAGALSQARAAWPGNAQAWLLSATLSRRLGQLPAAQAQIEKAAQLLPIDPEIGLEAGVIAMLAGREAAARKSWQSVIAAAPRSEAAATARGYLAQLDPPVGAQGATTR